MLRAARRRLPANDRPRLHVPRSAASARRRRSRASRLGRARRRSGGGHVRRQLARRLLRDVSRRALRRARRADQSRGPSVRRPAPVARARRPTSTAARRSRSRDAHFAELQALAVPRITRPERYFLLVETGDEVLDYREARRVLRRRVPVRARRRRSRVHRFRGADPGDRCASPATDAWLTRRSTPRSSAAASSAPRSRSACATSARDLLVLDEGDVAYRAARGNFGLIWVQGKGLGLPGYAAWTQRSAREWPRLAADLAPRPASTSRCASGAGCIFATASASSRRARRICRRCSRSRTFRRTTSRCSTARALARPAAGSRPGRGGGTWCAARWRLQSAAAAARAARGRRAARAAATAGRRRRDASTRARGASAAHARAATSRRARRARRGPRQRAARADGRARRAGAPQQGPDHRARAGGAVPAAAAGNAAPDRRRHGADRRFAAGRSASTSRSIRRCWQRWPRARSRVSRAWRDARVVRAWAALRVMSPDGFPIYAQSRAHPGAFVATCHSGVTLAAAHAHVLAPGDRSRARCPPRAPPSRRSASMFARLPDAAGGGGAV